MAHYAFFSIRPSKKNIGFFTNLLPLRGYNEVYIGNNLKNFDFGRVLNPICVKKNLNRICMIT